MLYAIKYYTNQKLNINVKNRKNPGFEPYLKSWSTINSVLKSPSLRIQFDNILFSEKLEMFNETQIGCTADCHVGCPEGTYRLPGMVECKPRLNCDQIRNLTKGRNLIGGGGVKRVNIQKKLRQFLDKDQVQNF